MEFTDVVNENDVETVHFSAAGQRHYEWLVG